MGKLNELGFPGQVVSCSLPGEVQTVNRAENYALIMLLDKLEPNSVITYVTDHLNLAKKSPKGIE